MVKLFKIWESDGNDRDEYAHVKANDIQDVIDWLEKTYFKPEALDKIDIDVQSDDDAYIMWSECDKDECAQINEITEEDKEDMCQECEQSQSSLTVESINEPDADDEDFKTIYGTNEFYDLTTQPPTKKPDWNSNLAATWKADPQAGANKLLALTLESQARGKKLEEMKE